MGMSMPEQRVRMSYDFEEEYRLVPQCARKIDACRRFPAASVSEALTPVYCEVWSAKKQWQANRAPIIAD